MGFFSKDISTMDDLFVHTLRDIYYAEQEILKALPTMIEKATNPELRAGLQQHLAETRNHVHRVEQVFQMHGVERETVNSPAIDGIIEEADEIASDVDNKEVLDAALIAAAQAVEHYEITRYGALVSWAKQLGRSDCASVLHRNLEEEKAADQKLTQIAEAKVNLEAAR
jgi:ferritin-like metal-binding protein YciE